jgi:hypothetical protein
LRVRDARHGAAIAAAGAASRSGAMIGEIVDRVAGYGLWDMLDSPFEDSAGRKTLERERVPAQPPLTGSKHVDLSHAAPLTGGFRRAERGRDPSLRNTACQHGL